MLSLRVSAFGDFSTYTLRLVGVKNIDPRYDSVDFSFKVNCPSTEDCAAVCACSQPGETHPAINYLAKDYATFRQLILDRLAVLMPDWRERHAPDLMIALVEVLAYTGDYLSYYQDAVATEAYLDTARQRISVRRHGRLVDYLLHEGCNARAWICAEVSGDVTLMPREIACITGLNEALSTGLRVLGWEDLVDDPAETYEVFEPLVDDPAEPIVLHASHNRIRFHTWRNTRCCLERGSTSATLADAGTGDDRALDLAPGDVLIFEEVVGVRTGLPADADPSRRHAVRLTAVSRSEDPLGHGAAPTPVLEIEWGVDDALPFPFCLSAMGPAPECRYIENITIARGNVILVDHGRTVDEEALGTVPTGVSEQSCECAGRPGEVERRAAMFRPSLRHHPVTFSEALPTSTQHGSPGMSERIPSAAALMRQNVRRASAQVWLTSDPAQPWTARADLIGSTPSDPHFVVEVDNERIAHLRFGDGELGLEPPAGLTMSARYRIGSGMVGNVGAEAIGRLVVAQRLSGVSISIRNPIAAAGGADPEPLAEAKLVRAPRLPHGPRPRRDRRGLRRYRDGRCSNAARVGRSRVERQLVRGRRGHRPTGGDPGGPARVRDEAAAGQVSPYGARPRCRPRAIRPVAAAPGSLRAPVPRARTRQGRAGRRLQRSRPPGGRPRVLPPRQSHVRSGHLGQPDRGGGTARRGGRVRARGPASSPVRIAEPGDRERCAAPARLRDRTAGQRSQLSGTRSARHRGVWREVMSGSHCHCGSAGCGCCEGLAPLTPLPTANRPGLPALRYRAGTHGAFFETMKGRLATMEVDAIAADGQTIERVRPLVGLTTRDAGDPAIALLDAWATVGDVLTFYQERIANEGYLRTATERRSVLELARLVGYALRPGVASTVFLAYLLDDLQLLPVQIEAGARAQSIPGPGEQPQSFETGDPLTARTEWNDLHVRRARPQRISFDNALSIERIYIDGISAGLKKGNLLLLAFDTGPSVVRAVYDPIAEPESGRTNVALQPVPPLTAAALPALFEFIEAAAAVVTEPGHGAAGRMLERAQEIAAGILLGVYTSPLLWTESLTNAADGDVPDLEDAFQRLSDRIEEITEGPDPPPPPPVVTDPSLFIPQLLKRRRVQPASSLQLSRDLAASFSEGADVQARLLVNLAPELKDTLYVAWANADVNAAASTLQGVFVFRTSAPLFGATVQKQPTFFTDDSDGTNPHFRGQPRPQSEWLEWTLDGEGNDTVFLDQPNEDILPGGFALVQRAVPFADQDVARSVHRIADVRTLQRTGYGFSGKTTRLRFEDSWWDVASDHMGTLRSTLVYAQTERLNLIEEPVQDAVQGQEIALARLYGGLEPGRWIILSGERADIPGVSGVTASELHMISGVRQDYDDSLPGDTTRTTLLLATPTAYAYQRAGLRIYGNVVKATHGETRRETLGSGDASIELQAFSLKQPPLTFVPAPSASGVESTLSVYVNDVKWHEAGALAGAGPADRVFTTRTDDTGTTTVVFGNGQPGHAAADWSGEREGGLPQRDRRGRQRPGRTGQSAADAAAGRQGA